MQSLYLVLHVLGRDARAGSPSPGFGHGVPVLDRVGVPGVVDAELLGSC